MKADRKLSPRKPKKGDVPACKAYARYCADTSANPRKTYSTIWMDFIMVSFFDEKEMGV